MTRRPLLAAAALLAVVLAAATFATAASDVIDVPSGSSLVGAGASASVFAAFLFWFTRSFLPAESARRDKVDCDHRLEVSAQHTAHRSEIQKLMDDHRQQVAALVQGHYAAIERIQARADSTLAQQRVDHAEMMKLQQETCQKELTSLGTALGGALASEIREELGTVNGAVRTLNQAMQAWFVESAKRIDRQQHET